MCFHALNSPFPFTQYSTEVNSLGTFGKLCKKGSYDIYKQVCVLVCVPVASVQVIFVSLAGTQLNCELSFHDSIHTVVAPQTALFEEQHSTFMYPYILGKPSERKQGLYLSQVLTTNSVSLCHSELHHCPLENQVQFRHRHSIIKFELSNS